VKEVKSAFGAQEEFYLDTLRAVATAGATAQLEVQKDGAAVAEGETR
jgi:hypothetical protein